MVTDIDYSLCMKLNTDLRLAFYPNRLHCWGRCIYRL